MNTAKENQSKNAFFRCNAMLFVSSLENLTADSVGDFLVPFFLRYVCCCCHQSVLVRCLVVNDDIARHDCVDFLQVI